MPFEGVLTNCTIEQKSVKRSFFYVGRDPRVKNKREMDEDLLEEEEEGESCPGVWDRGGGGGGLCARFLFLLRSGKSLAGFERRPLSYFPLEKFRAPVASKVGIPLERTDWAGPLLSGEGEKEEGRLLSLLYARLQKFLECRGPPWPNFSRSCSSGILLLSPIVKEGLQKNLRVLYANLANFILFCAA